MNGRASRVVVAAAVLVFFQSILFITYRVSTPSDLAWLEPGRSALRFDGVLVLPLGSSPDPAGLQPGDRVTAVAGRSLDDWAAGAFRPGASRTAWRSGDSVEYSVVRAGQPLTVTVRLGTFPVWEVLRRMWGLVLFALVSQLVGLFVFLRQPRDRSAQLLFLWSFCASNIYTWSLGLTVADLVQPAGWWLYSLGAFAAWLLYWGVTLHFALVFPRPHPLLAHFPRLPLLFYASALGLFLAGLAWLGLRARSMLEFLAGWEKAGYGMAAVHLSLMMIFILSSYRLNRDPAARRQLRWVVYGTVLSGGAGLLLWLIPPLLLQGQQLISVNAAGLMLLPFPLTIAAAVLRYRLFEIDVIIKRTLVYGSLTLVLAALYLVSVVLLQEAFRGLTGENRSPLVTILSTLGIAALFSPLRQRIQRDIDRRFDRQRYDAEQILAELLPSLRSEVELNQLSAEILNVVQRTMRPASVSLLLFRPRQAGSSQEEGKGSGVTLVRT